MEPENLTETAPLFSADYRGSGLLLHIASLPSPYGIGDIGPSAFECVDRLQAAGQNWWQSLPLGPTGHRDSPYKYGSSFAANPLLISPDFLIETELLRAADCQGFSFPPSIIDYGAVASLKHHLLHLAWTNFKAGARPDLKPGFEQFCQEHSLWLEDYTLFRALHQKFGGVPYLDWPQPLVLRDASALEHARRELAEPMESVAFEQYLLFLRGIALKEYAHSRGVRLIGDLSFFVPPDSSEVWARPEYFLLDENRRPRVVSGVPPDHFSSLGQTWGSPVYNWSALRETGFRWCIDRFRTLLAHVDVIRLDHFRGFAAAWHVPVGAPSARCGQWVQGPGAQLFAAVEQELGSLPFIAEDLGMITADVWHLLGQVDAPGTRVLQFAFDGHSDNPHLPVNYQPNTVAYTATHETPTSRAWYETLPPNERRNLWRYLRRAGGEAPDAAPALMGLAWSSRAALAMAPAQDLLNLGGTPGPWRWRAADDMLQAHAFEWLRQLTKATRRLAAVPAELVLQEIA